MSHKDDKSKSNYRLSGFTLVELIIVIVVVAILAAIALISYGNISQRATKAGVESEVNGIAKKLNIEQAETGFYPEILNAEVQEIVKNLGDNKEYKYTISSTDKTKACFSIADKGVNYSYAWSSADGNRSGYACGNDGVQVAYSGASGGGSTSTPTYDPAPDTVWTDTKTGLKWSYPIWNDGGTAKFSPTWTTYNSSHMAWWSWDGSETYSETQQQHTTNAKGKTAAQLCTMMGDGNWRIPKTEELTTAYTDGLRAVGPMIAGGTSVTTDNSSILAWSDEISSTTAFAVNLYNGSKNGGEKNAYLHVICVR